MIPRHDFADVAIAPSNPLTTSYAPDDIFVAGFCVSSAIVGTFRANCIVGTVVRDDAPLRFNRIAL